MLGRNSVLSFRDFRNLWLGQTISQFGDAVYALVLLFMAGHVSGDPLMVGLVGVLQAIPFVVLGPVAGILADRIDRRTQLIVADMCSVTFTLALSIYAFFHPNPEVWVLCLAAFLLATAHTFFLPARSAAIPRLVPKDQVYAANGLAMATQQVVAMAGIGLSAGALGLIYKLAPNYFFFIAATVNCLTFAFSVIFLLRLPSMKADREMIEKMSRQSFGKTISNALDQMKTEIKEGLHVMRGDAVVSVALPLNVIGTIFISGFMVVYIAVNKAWYGGEFGTLAWIEFSFAATMMVFSIVVGKLKVSRPGLSFAIAQAAIGILVVAMAWSKPYWLFIVVNALCGIVLPFIILPLSTYMQTAIHDSVRGRVNSSWAMVTQGMVPVGMALTGPMLKFFGAENSFIIMGAGLAASGIGGFFFPRFIAARIPDTSPESGDLEPALVTNLIEDEREILEPLT
ncbi:MAG: MFS transporter [Fimbriimonadaceae bacterium]|nr:MFS transporter [Fimbriimonadaceae bacterium]